MKLSRMIYDPRNKPVYCKWYKSIKNQTKRK